MDSMTQWMALLACGTAAALVTAWLSRRHYGRQMLELNGRVERSDKARAHANELLLQARRQIETLQKDLVTSRRTRTTVPGSRPLEIAAAAASPVPPPKRPVLHDDDEQEDTRIMPTHGFAETMPFEP